MSVELVPKDDQLFNMYWKIENLSYCWEELKSPVFYCSQIPCWLILEPKIIECRLFVLNPDFQNSWKTYEISFLTCDGSNLVSGCRGDGLRVRKGIIFGTRRSAFLPKDTLTIRFRYPTVEESGTFFIRSRIGVKRELFLFTTRYFNNDKKVLKKCIETSESYGIVELICRMMDAINTDKQVTFEIYRVGGKKCYIVFKASLLDAAGTALKEITDEFFFEKNDNQVKMYQIIKKNALYSCPELLNRKEPFVLTLKCDISFSLGELAEQSAVISYFEDVAPLLKESDLSTYFKDKSGSEFTMDLQTDLKSILDDGTLSDVTINVNSEVIKVHKSVLIARSPVFRMMFNQPMKETIDGTVVIEDLDVDTVRRLLLYMYADIITDYKWEDIKKLYFAADKYEVTCLKKKCVSFLKANLSVSNVCGVLALASLHRDEELKTAAYSFISMHGFSSETWKEVEDYDFALGYEMLLKICARGLLC